MKRFIVLLICIAFVSGLILISNDDAFAARKKKAESEEKTPSAVAEPTQAPEPKPIHKFKNDEEMSEFEQLYVSKQATFGRMGVLQAYFSMEQNNLAAIDKQMEDKFGFKMDPSKMYDLNRDSKEIREIGPVPQPAAAE